MILLVILTVVVGVFLLFRKLNPVPLQPMRHFDVQKDGFMWEFTVRPSGFVTPTILMALILGAAIAVVVLGGWLVMGHDLDNGGGLFFFAWAAGTVVCFAPLRKRAQKNAEGVRFSVGSCGVILPNGGGLSISGQYVEDR